MRNSCRYCLEKGACPGHTAQIIAGIGAGAEASNRRDSFCPEAYRTAAYLAASYVDYRGTLHTRFSGQANACKAAKATRQDIKLNIYVFRHIHYYT